MVPASPNNNLVVVSNRLPVSIEGLGRDHHKITPSSGGLVSGLQGLARSGVEFVWYGWPGFDIQGDGAARLSKTLLDDHQCVPVFLDEAIAESYYNGFSNSTIWPLFHYQLDKVDFNQNTMSAYKKANSVFADSIMRDLKDGDQVWVHDYHLMLLPLMLRQRAKDLNIKIRIGWFLHTPFPAKDFFDVLPLKSQILEGILGADIIGFQSDQALQNFLSACSGLVNYAPGESAILTSGREVTVLSLPIGIEPSGFHKRLRKSRMQSLIDRIKDGFDGAKIILGIDRLDCIKGIPQKLRAFDRVLEQEPRLIGKCVLVQVAIPSREGLKAHQDLKKEIQQLVHEINEKYGTAYYTPVHFLYTSLEPGELAALYAAAEVCFVSSLRDGMNLVCYEYIACHSDKASKSSQQARCTGSLVLSQFAGAAELLDGALLVNPWDQENCATALSQALSMEPAEARERMSRLGAKVEQQTSSRWGLDFVSALERVGKPVSSKMHSRHDSAVELEDLRFYNEKTSSLLASRLEEVSIE